MNAALLDSLTYAAIAYCLLYQYGPKISFLLYIESTLLVIAISCVWNGLDGMEPTQAERVVDDIGVDVADFSKNFLMTISGVSLIMSAASII